MDSFKQRKLEMKRLIKAENISIELVNNHLEEIRNTEDLESIVDENYPEIAIDTKHIVIDSLEYVKEENDD